MSLSRSASATPKPSKGTISGGDSEQRFPEIKTMEDVIAQFFNQIVQFVIEDMVVVEKKEEALEEKKESLVKDYKELKAEDLVDAEVKWASGSKVALSKKSSSRGLKSGRPGSSFASNLDAIKEEISEASRSKTSTTASSSLQDKIEDEYEAKIIFTNGNVYEGTISKQTMNGKGRYIWNDGTVYEGDFVDGFPTGKGEMTLPDLSHYEGEFNQGLFHGHGFLNIVSTPTFYSGEWRNGCKHGQGWLLYEPEDWYEGGWAYNLKDGFGVRFYKNGAKYRGSWREGKYDGCGTLIWENNDFYDGEWKKGLMHGQGEYIWGAFYNEAFAFPPQTIYRGSWEKGKRCGEGIMHFGDDTGLRLQGIWDQDFKHGDGLLICGNGRVVQQNLLFQFDKPKPKTDSRWSIRNFYYSHILDVPVFTAPEYVDVGFYVEIILSKLNDIPDEKFNLLRTYEEKCIRFTITRNLPKLKDLYKDYATMAAKIKLDYDPIMIRLFLWQLYKDMGLSKRISITRADEILAENPRSCLVSIHDPFEPIYFWQFLMSIIGIALSTGSLEETYDKSIDGGVCAFIVQKFLDEVIFSKAPDHQSTILMNYLDLAPIKAVYALYKKIGEPHSARTFLKQTCTKKGESPVACHLELRLQKARPLFGTNIVPLDEHITYEKERVADFDEKIRHHWTNLFDFRHLGPRNVMRCLATACPLVMDDNLVVNVDYPLTFLEFYETLLTCIFMVLELELKKEQKILSQSITPAPSVPSSPKVKTVESKKKLPKEKKQKKKKKK
ncbi:radial spoke head 10 homolog B [Tribolium castaneum]|uniref:Radial spoke head 10 homolog B-like Protein n=1 Tax=Tribolium castaneum TaxID=7070 RepID=D6WLY8_TRICA|nr:PREDICTED: radial spoke head 10 homolog B [Tribolium castaneum]EFA03382.1 Radial spoke head 10 homolog B-like Protein [Tribolium castaneum]|eukprot:XP_008193869.1 PREDICTED: radial spoke head 10 homolog B [Tribolium castaneum]